MTRFLQQRIKPLVSRFIPKAWCPSCGNTMTEDKMASDAENRRKTTKVAAKKGKKKS